MGTARLRQGDQVLPVIFLCKFHVLKNYKGNITSFLTKTFLGTYFDYLEFIVSPTVIKFNKKSHNGIVVGKGLSGIIFQISFFFFYLDFFIGCACFLFVYCCSIQFIILDTSGSSTNKTIEIKCFIKPFYLLLIKFVLRFGQ